jgi:hypothetical protein
MEDKEGWCWKGMPPYENNCTGEYGSDVFLCDALLFLFNFKM